jgi:maltose alpha-D-glucosyltransferase/alpha-amylase
MSAASKQPPGHADPLWYKDAVIYELHVRALQDSDGDGLGDFRGLTQKLDYLRDLGVTAIWLLPFAPSPWRDDGYDISDYTGVHPAYGTLRDFERFLKEAHRYGLRVITEIVLNHTSDQHKWFQRARRSPPGSKWRDFYVWSDTSEKYRNARIIFKDFENSNWTWDPVAKAYYWHRFYSHQPDLNFDSPYVREAVKQIADFWLNMGVDAFRLDAVPYLFERDGKNCENLPETHGYLRELRQHIDEKFPGRMLLAEANQWPEDAVAYFGRGDECHMAFHFPLMPRLFMASRMEDRFPIVEILDQTPRVPDNCQWAIFLRNHDELTLEMVTDDERDYMYRVYAHDRQMRINLGIRRRLAPLLGNDRRKIELMNALLLSMPGTPVIYYGDEIGMGDNIYLGDRNGVRTPMQWSPDRNAGFSRANPQKLYLPVIIDPEYHYEALNVEAQQNNANSLLWWMKRLIAQRNRHKAFGRGSIEFLAPSNRRVLAFTRHYDDETILVIANLSRFPQQASVDLSRYKGCAPVEMFGRAEFAPITDQPYDIIVGAHAFYWFSIESRVNMRESIELFPGADERPVLQMASLQDIAQGRLPAKLTAMWPGFLATRRWFLGKGRTILSASLIDAIPIAEGSSVFGVLRVEYSEGEADIYVVPVALATGEASERILEEKPDIVVSRVQLQDGQTGVLFSAVWDSRFADALLGAIARRRRLRGRSGELAASHTRAFRRAWGGSHPALQPAAPDVDQRNTSIIYGDRFALKIFRRLEAGTNPEIEMLSFLTEHGFQNAPPLTGSIEYRSDDGAASSAAVLTGFVGNHGDGWFYTLDALGRFFEQAMARAGAEPPGPSSRDPLTLSRRGCPSEVRELLGEYVESARLLGRRTAEMHLALSSEDSGPDFAPEPFTDHYRQGLYHGMMGLAGRCMSLLRQQVTTLSHHTQVEAFRVLAREAYVRACFRPLRDRRVETDRIRVHGDFNLRQVLYTGKDFILIDFEGDPSRAYTERKLKRSPLRDVAGMLRSLHYASYAALFGRVPGVLPSPDAAEPLERWASFWAAWAGALYLSGYLEWAGGGKFLPRSGEDLRVLLGSFLIERALSEVLIELTERPDWTIVPLRGISGLLDEK